MLATSLATPASTSTSRFANNSFCSKNRTRSAAAAASGTAAATWTKPRRRGQQQLDGGAASYPDAYIQEQLDRQAAVVQGLTSWAAAELPRYVLPGQQQWQPSDLLPDPSSDAYLQQLAELREEAQALPSEVLVVLAGLTVVASTAPNQLSQWYGTAALRDESGAADIARQPWARWRRSWTAERNKQRQLLLSYCYLCGCIDSRALDVTMQAAIGAGCDSGSRLPYQQLMHNAMQVRMSRVMFTNLAAVAAYHGAAHLARMATAIATDEGRHEVALVSAVSKLFAADAAGAVQALAGVVQQGVVLPGARMDDGWHQAGNPTQLPRSSSSSSSSNSSSVDDSSEPAEQQIVQQQQQQQRMEHQLSSADSIDNSADARCCSQLYVDFMAAADALGIWTVSDMAAAVEQCCRVWQVSRAAGPGSPSASSAAVQQLLSMPGMLRRLSELQLEGKLKARRRDRGRAAGFGWVFKREVPLS